MLATLTITLSLILLPTAAICLATGRRASLWCFLFVPLVGVDYGFFNVLSALSVGIANTPLKVVSIALVAGALTLPIGFYLSRASMLRAHDTYHRHFTPGLLLLILLAAALSCADILYILDINGWHTPNGVPYISNTPIQTDVQRTVNLVGEYQRHETRGFLYHSFWHQGAAAIVGIDGLRMASFERTAGVIAFTALLLFASLYWAIFAIRPKLSNRLAIFIFFGLLVASHNDFVYGLISFVTDGRWGQVAGEAISPIVFDYYFFRNFTAKLAGLVSPQQSIFLAYLAIFFGFYRYFAHQPLARAWGLIALLLTMCMFASPILTVLALLPFFPAYLLAKRIGGRRAAPIVALVAIVSAAFYGSYRLIYGFSLYQLYLSNAGGPSLRMGALNMLLAPGGLGAISFIVAGGLVTLAAFVLVVYWLASAQGRGVGRILRDPTIAGLAIGVVLWNYLAADSLLEIQRHFAMVTFVYSVMIVAHHLPLDPRQRWARAASRAFMATGIAATLINLNFVGTYALARNTLDLRIRYSDYTCINDKITLLGLKKGVIAAPYQSSIEYPLAFMATNSYINAQQFLSYLDSTPSQRAIVTELDRMGPPNLAALKIITVARDLGYDGVIWGPLEQRQWGDEIRETYLRPSEFVGACGQVGLYLFKPEGYQDARASTAERGFIAGLQADLKSLDDLFHGGYTVAADDRYFYATPHGNGIFTPPIRLTEDVLYDTTVQGLVGKLRQQRGATASSAPVGANLIGDDALANAFRKIMFIEDETFDFHHISRSFRMKYKNYLVFEPEHEHFVAFLNPEIADMMAPVGDGILMPPLLVEAYGAKDFLDKLAFAASGRPETERKVTFFWGHPIQEVSPGIYVTAPHIRKGIAEYLPDFRTYRFDGFRTGSLGAMEFWLNRHRGIEVHMAKEGYRGFNIVKIGDIFWAFSQGLGESNPRKAELGAYKGKFASGLSLESAERDVDRLIGATAQ